MCLYQKTKGMVLQVLPYLDGHWALGTEASKVHVNKLSNRALRNLISLGFKVNYSAALKKSPWTEH
jgi:hypothetical protein